MKRTKVRILKKRITNLIILAILILGIALIYKLYPLSKSERIVTSNVTYVDDITKEEISVLINSSDYDENGYYFALPQKINGIKVSKFYITAGDLADVANELSPGEKYYFTNEEIDSGITKIYVIYNTKSSKNQNLYYKSMEQEIDEYKILVEGYMPKDAEVCVNSTKYEDVESTIKQADSSLVLNIAYDIKIISSGQKYEPNDFDEDVKVTFSGVVKNNSNTTLKVMHINDEKEVEEIKSVSIENNDISFNAEEFSVYAIVSPSVELVGVAGGNGAGIVDVWDGTIATGYTFGNGTEENPYLITEAPELAYMMSQVNNGTTYAGTYFKLITSIDLDNNVWIPIGSATTSFAGNFNGQGFTISNTSITANGSEEQTYAYGFFGSLSGTSSNVATIRNLVFDNIAINLNTSATGYTDEFEYKIGIVAGAVYRYTKIENVIVKNSNISHGGWYSITEGEYPQFALGGIVGEAAYSAESSTTEVTDGNYIINNCFSDVDIYLGIGGNLSEQASRITLGGIIGKISWHNTWPTSCLYTGSISAETAMMGPIYGGQTLGSTEIATSISELSTVIWNSDTTSTMTSYYSGYTAAGTAYTTTCTTGVTLDSSAYRNMPGPWYVSYVKGVNKGIYIEDISDLLSMFNQNAINSDNCSWTYSNGTFSLNAGLDLDLTESPAYTFTVTPHSTTQTPEYTYSWYVNGTLDSTLTTNTASFEPSFVEDRLIRVMVNDGSGVAALEFIIRQLDLGLTIQETNGNLNAVFTGTGASLAKMSKYHIEWHEIDVIEGRQDSVLDSDRLYQNATLYHEYKVELTDGYEGVETLEATYLYGERNVVFVNNVSYTIDGTAYTGADTNTGTSPENAVKTLTYAYTLLDASGPIEKNIVIIIGNYNDTDYLDVRGGNQSSYDTAKGKFNKKATVTGKYRGQYYAANLDFSCKDNVYNGKYIFDDTRFEYIIFNGNSGSTFFYLQGHNITMGSGISMINYQSIDTSDLGQVKNLNSPKFSMFCGFHNYNYSTIPTNSKSSTVLIKSGTYGRVIAGGRNNSAGASIMTTSHNIFGSSTDYFTANITINYDSQSTITTPDVNLLVAGSTDSNIYVHSTINIKSGKVARVLGGNIGSNSVIYDGYPLNLFVGSTTINISGGDVSEIFGTSLGRWTDVIYYYGNVQINVTGGTIRSAIYGAGAASITGHNANYAYQYYSSYASGVTTNIAINVSGGEIIGNIYGGGYGYSSYLTSSVKEDGGALYGNSTITITGGTISGDIYGGGRGYDYSNKAYLAQMIGNSTINVIGAPRITGNIYGAGEGISGYDGNAKLIGKSTINIEADLADNIYGGGKIAKVTGDTFINLKSGTNVGAIYGGGKLGNITGNTNVSITGGTTAEIYGGGDEASVTESTITITNGIVTTVYGGGKQAGAAETNIELNDGLVTNIYGGSNQSGTVTRSNIIVDGGSATYIYGGNNAGGSTTISSISINGGTLTEIYGGGNQADTQVSNVYLRGTTLEVPNIYGGGKNAGVDSTYIYLVDGEAINVYGGSNQSGIVASSYVYLSTANASAPHNLNIENIYGGNNAGGSTTTTNIYGYQGTATNVYGGGNSVDGSITNIQITGGIYTDIYGGSNQTGDIANTNVNISGGTIANVYGGNNAGGTIANAYINITGGTTENVYGGNNAGGGTTTATTEITAGSVTNVYGGGNQAATTTANMQIESEISGDVYGGGNQASVFGNTNIVLDGASISNNVYGGGNEGRVLGNTNLTVTDSTITQSVYGGGNGPTAIVTGNTNLTIDGTTSITGHVFGGGNHASTGDQLVNNSVSTVNIVGAIISGNVYGGANTSVVCGRTNVNIGNSVSNINNLQKDDIYIGGTVFGGGEANASGSEIYDYSFISVTSGVEMNIDAEDYTDFVIAGSIFGSGNASTTTGDSNIYIDNYGTYNNPKTNVSIQRASTVTLNNSAIWIAGATDRTNEYSTTVFSLSRIDELKLKNNSTLYLQNSSNLLQKVSSVVDNGSGEQKATVTVSEQGAVTTNVDNRIYLKEGVNLNIATNEQVTTYGEVYGMFFLGLYTGKNQLSLGVYSKSYDIGDEVANNDRAIFTRNSYVLGAHLDEHNTMVDGFYTNYKDDENVIYVDYITPTPSNDLYYIWNVGDQADVTVFNVELIGSKYNTLGTCELQLLGFSTPNTVFEFSGSTYDLVDGISLVDRNEIQNIEDNQTIADTTFGLGIETGKNSWMMEGLTRFISSEPYYTGTTMYLSDNSEATPTLNFYLYHSQNISVEQELGTVSIIFTAIEQVDDLNKIVRTIVIDVDMSTALFQDSYYEAAITPGERYDLFTTTQTNITTESEFSQYYSLCIENFSESDYYEDYVTCHRCLVASTVLPQNTTITMIDMRESTSEYYYYTVTAEDVASSKKVYDISQFKKMGSSDKYYNEDNDRYYNASLDIENEEFIFQFDFSNANLSSNIVNQTILLEYRNDDNETLIGVLGIQREGMKYSIYNTGSNISVSATTSSPSIYLGDSLYLNVVTSYNQTISNGKLIYDTNYFGQKLGIKITLYDGNGEQVTGSSLLGVFFRLNGVRYYPRVDGTTRINIASTVSNVASSIKVYTNNSNLASGNYTIKVEAFSSPDGIYYGLESADEVTVPITILNSIYGLSVNLADNMMIIDSASGNTLNENNNLNFNVEFSSGLLNPNIKISLYRRDYSSVYSNTYTLVDLQDYVTQTLTTTDLEDTYLATNLPTANFDYNLSLNQNLVTGTYKVVFALYDGNTYIGQVYQYIIIN